MKEDPIERLIKESRLETSRGFTDRMMERIEARLQRKLRTRLYLMVVSVVVLCLAGAWALIVSGYRIPVFGLLVSLPKTFTIIGLGMTSCLTLLHLFLLHQASRVLQS